MQHFHIDQNESPCGDFKVTYEQAAGPEPICVLSFYDGSWTGHHYSLTELAEEWESVEDARALAQQVLRDGYKFEAPEERFEGGQTSAEMWVCLDHDELERQILDEG